MYWYYKRNNGNFCETWQQKSCLSMPRNQLTWKLASVGSLLSPYTSKMWNCKNRRKKCKSRRNGLPLVLSKAICFGAHRQPRVEALWEKKARIVFGAFSQLEIQKSVNKSWMILSSIVNATPFFPNFGLCKWFLLTKLQHY